MNPTEIQYFGVNTHEPSRILLRGDCRLTGYAIYPIKAFWIRGNCALSWLFCPARTATLHAQFVFPAIALLVKSMSCNCRSNQFLFQAPGRDVRSTGLMARMLDPCEISAPYAGAAYVTCMQAFALLSHT